MTQSVDTVNRSSLLLVEQDGLNLEEAIAQLATFQLQLECGEDIRYSLPLQAALLTAVNTANRAFLGGVHLLIPMKVVCLLPWEKGLTLNEILLQLGANIVERLSPDILTLTFGIRGNVRNNKVEVIATNWKGGILVNGEMPPEISSGTLPLGGIYAGGLAVALSFLKISKIHPMSLDKSAGVSLWRPDLNWLDEEAEGLVNPLIPNELWVLGLGHLGQAYLWTIGLFTYLKPDKVNIMLQDFDKVVEANLSAGLLCYKDDAGRYKSRVCSDWLEKRGIYPKITDRKFNSLTQCGDGEPIVALCGFDNALARTFLEKANFSFIVEAGLGNSVDDFDRMIMHVFPSKYHAAEKEWEHESNTPVIKKKVLDAIKDDKQECGITAITIAGKSASASFVGACTASFVLAELVKGFNNGLKADAIISQLRFPDDIKLVNSSERYTFELGLSDYQKTLEEVVA